MYHTRLGCFSRPYKIHPTPECKPMYPPTKVVLFTTELFVSNANAASTHTTQKQTRTTYLMNKRHVSRCSSSSRISRRRDLVSIQNNLCNLSILTKVIALSQFIFACNIWWQTDRIDQVPTNHPHVGKLCSVFWNIHLT